MKCHGRRTLTAESAEPLEGYVISCKVAASRNLDGTPFPPAASRDQRQEVEHRISGAALQMEGALKGTYFPLVGSSSYPSKPDGMTLEEEKMLTDDHLLFQHPDAPAVLSTGSGRHWPHGRGVFVNERKTLTLWINEEEHLKATSQRQGGDARCSGTGTHFWQPSRPGRFCKERSPGLGPLQGPFLALLWYNDVPCHWLVDVEDLAEAESEMDRPTSECDDQDIPEGFSSTDGLHEEIRGAAPASGDLGRRIQGAAATIGGATGMLLGGPVSGALLGAAALYASTREDMPGSVARKAGSLYLKVADRACDEGVRVMDRGVEKAGAALDRGCKKLSQSSSVPAPIRAGLQQLAGDKREAPSVAPDEARKILEKHPDRIPIICERSAFSTLPQISKSKFAVPGGMRAGEFKYLVARFRKRSKEQCLKKLQVILLMQRPGIKVVLARRMYRFSWDIGRAKDSWETAVSVIVKLPLLKQKKEELLQWCSARRLVGKGAISESGDRMPDLVEVSSRDRIDITEEETVNMLVEGVAQLVRAERLMELGTSAAEALAQPPSLAESTAASGARAAGDLTPIDVPDVGSGSWDAAGSTLQDMISNAVVTSCTALGDGTNEAAGSAPDAERDWLELRQRLAGSIIVAAHSGQLEQAAKVLSEDAAAKRIQALQRGKSARTLVQQEKAEKVGAATKIQAVQRGKKTREDLQNLEGSKDPVAQEVPPQETTGTGPAVAAQQEYHEFLRQRLAGLLSTAAQDGSLQ
ncbi:unnamed protein product, partial [Symbiodinium microadriaticum]